MFQMGLPFAEITNDFGTELGVNWTEHYARAHSSAALVVNTFGPWQVQPGILAHRR
jgi:hypothetical protein